jgi:hypothetical protein
MKRFSEQNYAYGAVELLRCWLLREVETVHRARSLRGTFLPKKELEFVPAGSERLRHDGQTFTSWKRPVVVVVVQNGEIRDDSVIALQTGSSETNHYYRSCLFTL